jgi:hypothetical protein
MSRQPSSGPIGCAGEGQGGLGSDLSIARYDTTLSCSRTWLWPELLRPAEVRLGEVGTAGGCVASLVPLIRTTSPRR